MQVALSWLCCSFYAGGTSVSAEMLLPFSPVRLMLLVIWLYIGLYCVQKVQFSYVVPTHHKSWVSALTFFMGPLVLFAFFISTTISRYSQSDRGILAMLRHDFTEAFDNIRGAPLVGARGRSSLILFDSSGKSLSESSPSFEIVVLVMPITRIFFPTRQTARLLFVDKYFMAKIDIPPFVPIRETLLIYLFDSQ